MISSNMVDLGGGGGSVSNKTESEPRFITKCERGSVENRGLCGECLINRGLLMTFNKWMVQSVGLLLRSTMLNIGPQGLVAPKEERMCTQTQVALCDLAPPSHA